MQQLQREIIQMMPKVSATELHGRYRCPVCRNDLLSELDLRDKLALVQTEMSPAVRFECIIFTRVSVGMLVPSRSSITSHTNAQLSTYSPHRGCVPVTCQHNLPFNRAGHETRQLNQFLEFNFVSLHLGWPFRDTIQTTFILTS